MPDAMHLSQRARSAVFAPLAQESRAEIVARRLSDAIALGLLPDATQLPSESDLAARFGVATVTVREALTTLRHRGLVETRRGRGGGSFVTAPPDPAAAALLDRLAEVSPRDLRDLGDPRCLCSRNDRPPSGRRDELHLRDQRSSGRRPSDRHISGANPDRRDRQPDHRPVEGAAGGPDVPRPACGDHMNARAAVVDWTVANQQALAAEFARAKALLSKRGDDARHNRSIKAACFKGFLPIVMPGLAPSSLRGAKRRSNPALGKASWIASLRSQ